MNVADIDDLQARLELNGGTAVADPAGADLVLVNTCTVRAKAEEKAYSFFGELKRLKNGSGREPLLVAIGCVVPRNREVIARRFPHLDLLVDYSDPDSVMDALREHFPPLANTADTGEYEPLLDPRHCPQRFVTAIRGCNHGCSFCVVPRARGPQRDVPLSRIVSEARALELAGAPDLTVLGQNILGYGTTSGDRRPRFIELMSTLLAETGFRWITFLTSLPGDLTDGICEQVIAHPRVTPLLHLPVQSGSDKVLSDMQRGHDVAHYRRLVSKARDCRPDLYLTTDLLVGFPTETEADFQATLELVEEIGFDDAFMFAYSERPGTLAARRYEDILPRSEKHRRLAGLIERQRELGAARNQRHVGQVLDLIIEHADEQGAVGRTAFNKPVQLARASTAVGQYSRARIMAAKVSSFSGEEVQQQE
jgi:tRNA-2-methylthio-N6-dimethylallyladenosine synthase